MHSTGKLNKQGNNRQPWCTPFPICRPICCSMPHSNCGFLTCTEVSQQAGKMVWALAREVFNHRAGTNPQAGGEAVTKFLLLGSFQLYFQTFCKHNQAIQITQNNLSYQVTWLWALILSTKDLYSSSPQTFWHPRPVSWKTVFPQRMGEGGGILPGWLS